MLLAYSNKNRYDVGILLLVFVLVSVALLLGDSDDDAFEVQSTRRSAVGDWRLYSQLFWIRVLSGYLALPFVFFKIPVLNTLLLHTSRTGYDRAGHTVPVIKMFTPPQPDT